MLRTVAKGVVVAVSAVVVVPYTVAFVAHVLYGWPRGAGRYRRALAPCRVLALNYSLLQQLGYLRFARMFFNGRNFYRDAVVMRLLKEIPFGSNNNTLDLYFPRQTRESLAQSLPQPVIVFVYGGSWGSGDKRTYALLGAQLADNLSAIVCIPNYSTFPRGYVDDMVQDVVDCLSWVHKNIDKYGGDKENLVLVGHSAGAHLAVMAVIELTLKRLMHNPQAAIRADGQVTPPPAALTESLRLGSSGVCITPLTASYKGQATSGAVPPESITFEDRHFDRSSQSNSENGSSHEILTPPKLPAVGVGSTAVSGSFFYVSEDEKGRRASSGSGSDGRLSASGGSESFFLVKSGGNGDNGNGDNGNGAESTPSETALTSGGDGILTEGGALEEQEAEAGPLLQSGIETPGEETQPTKFEAPVEAPAVGSEETETGHEALDPLPRPHTPVELVIEDDDAMTRSQRSVRDLLQSIRCLIGLAGVYDIVDHYQHEATRGVEDISSMGKAMYGPEHFHRFSPTQIVATLPHRTRFPPVLLVHGTGDVIVPVSSTERFASAVSDMGSQVVEYHVPGCPHADICLDLMSPERPFHTLLMGLLRQAAHTYAK